MNIKELLSQKITDINAICVLTRVGFDYLIKTETSLAWVISYERAKEYTHIVIISLGGNGTKRGQYIVADIDIIYKVAEIKRLYRENKLTPKLSKLIEEEKNLFEEFGIDAVFSETNLQNDYEDDERRLVIIFKKETIKEGFIHENFKGLSNPAFYIHKHKVSSIFSSEKTKNNKKNLDENKLLKFENLKISNFINFNDMELDFSPNINLIIGKNNTGKTSLIKFLYSIIKSLEEFEKQKHTYKVNYKELLSMKIREVFQSEKGLGAIVNYSSDANFEAQIELNHKKKDILELSLSKTITEKFSKFKFSDNLYLDERYNKFPDFNSIFIPSKELLSAFKIIRAAFDNRKFGFDATYSDTINSFINSFKKEGINDDFLEIIQSVEDNFLNGKIEQELRDDKFFYINANGNKFEMALTAEGIKQLGIIPTLIKTGELRKGTILFLDEPDNNLNPVAIREFVNILVLLSKAGVQIFLTSHNYFIIKRLYIAAKTNKKLLFKAFSLIDYNDNDKIDIEIKNLKFGLPKYNPIVEEAINMFNDDIKTELQ